MDKISGQFDCADGRKRWYVLLGKVVITAATACTLAGMQGQALAEEGDSNFDADAFDASEFSVKSFTDESFNKRDFRDVKSRSSASVKRFELKIRHKKRSANDLNLGDDTQEESGAGERRAFEQNFGVIYELAGDWAPSKIDLTSNGAFTNYPGNGSPVPYTLNGHVDIERGKP